MADYSTTASVVLTVNGQQAKKMLTDLQKQSEELGKKIKAATDAHDDKALKKYKAELRNVNRMMDQIKNSGQKVDAVLQRLDKATPKELNKALVELKRQLNGIERGSEAWNKHVAKIKQVKAQIAELNAEMKVQQTWTQRLASKFNEFGASIMAAAAGMTGLILAGKKAVSEFAQMDEAMANTQKFTGMTAEQVRDLNEEFKKMDTRTTRDKLNELAQEAGRLGKTSKEDIMGYVQAADILNVALSDLGDGATQKIAKLSNIFGVEETEGTYNAMVKIGSVINVLSQNSTASKPYLVEFTNRLAGVGNQANLTVQQIVGLGAVLDANAQKVEASATAISQVLTRMFVDPAKYARVAGLDVEKFANLLKTDANEALLQFLEALNKAGNMDVLAPMFKDMGESGARAIAAMSTLASKIDDVRWQQQNANQAFEEGTSVLHEYEIFNNTAQASIDKARKRIQELSIQLGEKLMPIMSHIMSSGTFTLKLLNNLVDFVIKFKSEIITAGIALLAFRTYILAYNASTVAAAKVTVLWNNALKYLKGLGPVVNAVIVALTNAVKFCTNGFKVSRDMIVSWGKAWRALSMTSWVGIILTVASAVMILVNRFRTAREEAEKAAKAQEEFRKSIRSVDEQAEEYSTKEVSRLERLYKAATSEYNSRKDRIKAVESLQSIYPDYFGNVDKEIIMAGQAASAYYDLRDSIVEAARARAASDLIEQNTKELLKLEKQYKDLSKQQLEALSDYNAGLEKYKKAMETPVTFSPGAAFGQAQGAKDLYLYEPEKNLRNIESALEDVIDKMDEYKEANADLEKQFGKAITKNIITEEIDGGNGGNDDGDDIDNKVKDRFDAEKAWREKAEAEARISYRTGEMDYIQYTQRMDVIAEQFYQKQLEHTDLSENERLKITAQYLDAQAKTREDWQKALESAENGSFDARIAELKQFYIDGEITSEAYNTRLEELEIEHQKALVEITEEGSAERVKAEAKLQDLLLAQMRKRQQEVEKIEAEYAKIKDKFFGMNDSERLQKYNEAMQKLTDVFEKEISNAQSDAEIKRIKEAFKKAQEVIKKEFGFQDENPIQTMVDNQIEWLESEGTQRILKTFNTIVSGMSSIFSQLSSYIQAELELQTAQLDKYYDKEIERAEGNSYRIQKLEKEKEQKLAKIKQEANKKLFAMQVFEAVAQTAQNAISAYGAGLQIGGLAGLIMAPIAAAMAVAAGGIQIAAIKKQQQAAEAQGYSEGGFTPNGPKDKEVGIVHAGEWVASQKLVNNPSTRPMIEALDYAQRTNTIGSISSRDVSRSITAPMVLAHGGASSQPNVIINVPDNSSSNEELNNTLDKLNQRLEEPFVTINTVYGDYGIDQAQSKYNRLLNNKSPKSKKPKSNK